MRRHQSMSCATIGVFFLSRRYACHITLWFLLLASSIQRAPGLSGRPNEWEMEQNDTWRLATTGQVRRTHGHDRQHSPRSVNPACHPHIHTVSLFFLSLHTHLDRHTQLTCGEWLVILLSLSWQVVILFQLLDLLTSGPVASNELIRTKQKKSKITDYIIQMDVPFFTLGNNKKSITVKTLIQFIQYVLWSGGSHLRKCLRINLPIWA